MLVFSTRKFKQWCKEHHEIFSELEKHWTSICEGKEAVYNPTIKDYEIEGYLISKTWCVNRK